MTRIFTVVAFTAILVTGCQTIQYNPKAVSVMEAYGAAVDLHIVTVGTAWANCYAALGAAGQSRIDHAHKKDNLSLPEKQAVDAIYVACDGAHFEKFQTFYDAWDSRLFTAQQQASAGDVLGICRKAGKYAVEFAATVSDKALWTGISRINFEEGKGCSFATIGGVIAQHRLLRQFHTEFNVIDRDNGKVWRETIAQSVRIALTVEKFKKSAAEDSGSIF